MCMKVMCITDENSMNEGEEQQDTWCSLLPMGVPVHVKIAFALATHGIDDVKPLYLPVTAH